MPRYFGAEIGSRTFTKAPFLVVVIVVGSSTPEPPVATAIGGAVRVLPAQKQEGELAGVAVTSAIQRHRNLEQAVTQGTYIISQRSQQAERVLRKFGPFLQTLYIINNSNIWISKNILRLPDYITS